MKHMLRFVFALLLVGGMAAVVINQNTVARLRVEHDELLKADAEAKQLTAENREIQRLRAENAEVQQLLLANKDLPKLRNDVRQLRREAEEAQKLRSENERLAASLQNASVRQSVSRPRPSGFIAKANLMDAGLGSPEAAVQTFFWAACNGNQERLYQSSTVYGEEARKEDPNQFRQQMAAMMNRFDGFAITAKKDTSPDEVVLTLQSHTDAGGMEMKVVRVGNEWKVAN